MQVLRKGEPDTEKVRNLEQLKKTQQTGILKFNEFSNIRFNLNTVKSSLRKAWLTQDEIQHEPPREFFLLLDICLFKVSVIMNINNA